LGLILQELTATVDGLLALALEKQEAVIKYDVESLQNLTLQEEELLGKLKSLEELYLNGAHGDGYETDCINTLKDKISKLLQTNKRNQVLLEKGLDLIRYELKLILPDQGYDSNAINNSLLFDERT
jgi:hypothetical protein